jgi:alpha,alpha-trehalase
MLNKDLSEIIVQCADKNIEKVMIYIHQHWKELIRISPPYTKKDLFYLPYPYAVPGGIFQQLFYWDSYFMILGLKISKLHQLAKDIVNNFFYELKTFGLIPNSSELAHLSRSQPPILTSIINEVWDGDMEWLHQAYEWAKIEYKEVCMDSTTHFHEQIGLNKYYDRLDAMLRLKGEYYLHFNEIYIPQAFWHERVEAESGWDYTGRFNRQCGNFIPVDLNSLLYKYETDFAKFARILKRNHEAHEWEQRALHRKRLMNQYLWNQSLGIYVDYDFVNRKQSAYYSLAMFFPLWVQLASKQQAEMVAHSLPIFLTWWTGNF